MQINLPGKSKELSSTLRFKKTTLKRASHWLFASLLASIVLFGNIQSVLAAVENWAQKSTASKPSGRNGHAMSNISGDKVLLFGGYDGSSSNDETWVYDLSANTWTQQSPASKPSARGQHAVAKIGADKVLLFGGFDGARDNETWVYDLSENSWTQMSPLGGSQPSERYDHRMANIGGDKVLLVGGSVLGSNHNDETWVYDLSANTWTQISPIAAVKPPARSQHAMASLGGDKVLLFGGFSNSFNVNDLWVYDLSANTWIEQKPSVPPSIRARAEMANIGGDKVLLFGGIHSSAFDESWVYDFSANTWTQQSPAAKPSGRNGHELAAIGEGLILLFGGHDGAYDDQTWLFSDKKPGAFGKTSPSDSATNQSKTPTLTWQVSSAASTYNYCLEDVINGKCDAKWFNAGDSTSLTLPFSLKPGTIYEWLIRANNPSGSTYSNGGTFSTFTTKAIPVPTPKTPGGNIVDRTPKFVWSKIKDATNYQIQLKKGRATVYKKSVSTGACGSSTCSNTPSTTLLFSAYKWRVRAKVDGVWSAWSTFKKFKIVNPTPITKKPSGDISDRTPKYVWTKIKASGVTNYQIQLKRGTNTVYTKLLANNVCGRRTCSNTPSKNLALAKYKWRVRSKVNGTWSPWSPYRSFTLK